MIADSPLDTPRPSFVDSHCHLNYPKLVERQAEAVAAAKAAGVGAMLNISTCSQEWEAVIATAEKYEGIYASVGIHPHEADAHEDISTQKLVAASAHPKVIGIGETGLDYYYDHSDREQQRKLFKRHIAAARETQLPIIIHTRDAEADTAEILRSEMALGSFAAIIHCFTASDAFAAVALELGCYISISGIVTFKSAVALQASAKTIPADRLLIETDSPFLAPVPHRSKPCEPAFVVDTAKFLAQLRGVELAELAAQTSANFYRVFAKAVA
jgi:TatD DNase family protein